MEGNTRKQGAELPDSTIIENGIASLAKPPNDEVVVTEMEKLELRRELGLPTATGLVFGFIVGTGIFISPKGVMEATGSVGLNLTVWIFCGICALFDGLCHAELGTMIHKGGGDYTYIKMGVGNFWAFSFAVQSCLFLFPIVTVIMAQTFASYFVRLLPPCGQPLLLQKLISAALIVTLYVINVYSSKMAARVSSTTSLSKLLALAVIIVAGFIEIGQGTTSELSSGFEGTVQEPASLAMALFSGMFAYVGGSNINILVEEMKNPVRNIPLSIVLSTITVTVVYVLTNVAYLAVMTPEEMIASNAVGVTFADRALGGAAIIIPLAVMVATLGSLNNLLIAGSRLLFIAARDKNVPDVLSFIQVDQLTPLCSTTMTVILSLLYLSLPGTNYDFINYVGFLSALNRALLFVAFIRFRFTMKDVDRPIKVPIVMAVFLLLLNIYMFVAPITIDFKADFLYVGVIIIGGCALLYVPFVRFKWSLPFYDTVVTQVQLILHVCPPAKFAE